MNEQSTEFDQSSDQEETGFFLSVDLFDQLMISLAAIYSRLHDLEENLDEPDPALVEKYLRRHGEILVLKESFPVDAITKRSKAADVFIRELQESRRILQGYLENT